MPLENILARAMTAAHPSEDPVTFGLAAESLSREMGLLDDAMERGAARALVWSSPDALIVSRRDSRLPGFSRAAAYFEREHSIPVVVRASGGSAVLVGPGVVNVALVYATAAGSVQPIDVAYTVLHSVVSRGLRDFRIVVGLGAVPGSYCDGSHNIICGGLKIAGTAQRRRRGAYAATLVHASLLVNVDLRKMIGRLNHFYAMAGAPSAYLESVCTTVAHEAVPRPGRQWTAELTGTVIESVQAAARDWEYERMGPDVPRPLTV